MTEEMLHRLREEWGLILWVLIKSEALERPVKERNVNRMPKA